MIPRPKLYDHFKLFRLTFTGWMCKKTLLVMTNERSSALFGHPWRNIDRHTRESVTPRTILELLILTCLSSKVSLADRVQLPGLPSLLVDREHHLAWLTIKPTTSLISPYSAGNVWAKARRSAISSSVQPSANPEGIGAPGCPNDTLWMNSHGLPPATVPTYSGSSAS